MKLFDTLFHILEETGEKLILGGDLEIFAIKYDDKPNEPASYYMQFEHNRDRSWASERLHPTRRQIEEHLTKIILEEKTRPKEIEEFLNQHLPETNTTFLRDKSIRELLKKDHPEIVKKVETYSDEERKDATAELIMEILMNSTKKLGRGDKETYEEFWYVPLDNKFHYQEGDTLGYGDPRHEQTYEKEEFKNLLKNHWIALKDGIITGPGSPTGHIPYWLKEMGLGSIRDYIEMKNK